MSSLYLSRKQLLQQARALLNEVQKNIKTGSFSSDNIWMETYNDLIAEAANLFPEDSILNGQMVEMPDAVLQAYDPEYGGLLSFQTMPLELPSQRTAESLKRLINRLEILLVEEPTQQPLDERDFSFVADHQLREVLRLDFIEAQKSFAVGAYKACGLLCGGLIEGMLLDISSRPYVVTEQQLNEIAKELKLPRNSLSIDWNKVSMTNLIKMSGKFGLVSEPALKFAEGARDIRDTIHPHAEARQGRASEDEASTLLKIVRLIYNKLVARFGQGEKE